MSLLIRFIMALAGVIASWFVARDAPNFTFLQTIASLIVIVILLVGAALGPSIIGFFRSRQGP